MLVWNRIILLLMFVFQSQVTIPPRKVTYIHYQHFAREKGRDLTQSYAKSPYTHRTIQKASWQHKNATKNFDYTTIADRLRTVSWGIRNIYHPPSAGVTTNNDPHRKSTPVIFLRRKVTGGSFSTTKGVIFVCTKRSLKCKIVNNKKNWLASLANFTILLFFKFS